MLKKMMFKKMLIFVFYGTFGLTSGLFAQGPDARRPGEEVLYEALLGAKGFLVVVESNGCTQKESFQVDHLKKKNQDGSIHYVFTVNRKSPDNCKRKPVRVIIHFDFKNDLGIKGIFTYSLTNKIFPATAEEESLYSILEKYFSFGEQSQQRTETPPPIKIESKLTAALKEEIERVSLTVRSQLKKAMIFSIESEIDRFQKRGDQGRVAELNEELKKFRTKPETDFPLPPEEPEQPTPPTPLTPGAILPPRVEEAEVIVNQPLRPGAILEVVGQTKSGPFYHLAGSRAEILSKLKPGRKYPVILYLIYKREYFGSIPNYYVYLAGLTRD